MKYRIYTNATYGKRYLDGFDGTDFEWTSDRRKAWQMTEQEADNRIKQLDAIGLLSFVEPTKRIKPT